MFSVSTDLGVCLQVELDEFPVSTDLGVCLQFDFVRVPVYSSWFCPIITLQSISSY